MKEDDMRFTKMKAEVKLPMEDTLDQLVLLLQELDFSLIAKMNLNPSLAGAGSTSSCVLLRSIFPKQSMMDQLLGSSDDSRVSCSILIQPMGDQRSKVEFWCSSQFQRSSQNQRTSLTSEADRRLNQIVHQIENQST